MSLSDTKIQTVLITGASCGIGCEIARVFAAKGYALILVARRRSLLEKVAAELEGLGAAKVRIIVRDLAVRAAAAEVFRELQAESVPVDILVNNAGYATYGPFVRTDLIEELGMLDLNIAALTHLTKLFLPDMIRRKYGRILNVASTAAFQPGPYMAAYFASKAYVFSFSQAVREELRGTGVSVTVLCPGPTTSEFQARAGIGKVRLFQAVRLMDAKAVAEDAYRGLMAGRASVIPGFVNKLLVWCAGWVPAEFNAKVLRFLQEEGPVT